MENTKADRTFWQGPFIDRNITRTLGKEKSNFFSPRVIDPDPKNKRLRQACARIVLPGVRANM
jgi:hypothetical protein